MPAIYFQLEVEEYLLLAGQGEYAADVFVVKLWRRDKQTKQLMPVAPDAQGRFILKTVGLQAGTVRKGCGLRVWDTATGERQRLPMDEEAWLRSELRKTEQWARLEAESRCVAVEAMERSHQGKQEAERQAQAAERPRREVELLNQEMAAESERLRKLVP